MKMTIAVMTFSLGAIAIADEPLTSTYGSLVDDTGNISLPGNFRSSWTFLGTWSIAEKDVEPSSAASGHGDDLVALYNLEAIASKGASCV